MEEESAAVRSGFFEFVDDFSGDILEELEFLEEWRDQIRIVLSGRDEIWTKYMPPIQAKYEKALCLLREVVRDTRRLAE